MESCGYQKDADIATKSNTFFYEFIRRKRPAAVLTALAAVSVLTILDNRKQHRIKGLLSRPAEKRPLLDRWKILTPWTVETRSTTKLQCSRIDAFYMWALRQILRIRYTRHVTNVEVRATTGCHPLSHLVTDRRLRLFGHIIFNFIRCSLNNSHIKKQVQQSNNTGVSRTRLSDK